LKAAGYKAVLSDSWKMQVVEQLFMKLFLVTAGKMQVVEQLFRKLFLVTAGKCRWLSSC
jgi:hypothetical protein